MQRITVYTKGYCPYCKAGKALLRERGLPFDEIDVQHDAEKFTEMVERSGRRTVPQVFFDNEHIGGYTDLRDYFTGLSGFEMVGSCAA